MYKRLVSVAFSGYIFPSIIILIISSCAGTGGFRELNFEDDHYKDIKVFGMFDKDISSKNFGAFQFVFENTSDKWLNIKNIRLSFAEDSATKYIKPLDERGLRLWSMAVIKQQYIMQSDFRQLQSALLSAGSSITGIDVDDEDLVGLATSSENVNYPENHLYAENFILLPNYAINKWIIFESSNHNHIPYVTNIKLEFDTDNGHKKANLKFRSESSRYKSFIWFDPYRKELMNFYLGLSISSGFPMGEFKDMATSEDFIINGFGLNAYITFTTNLGLNIALDYQSFKARAKLPVEPDSLLILNTEYEFTSWKNFALLLSPRFVLPLNVNLDLYSELTAGLVLSRSPKIIQKQSGLETGEINGENSFSLAGGFAIGSRFVLSKKTSIDLKAEYLFYLEPKFTYESANNEKIEVTQNMNQLKIKATLNWDI